MMELESGRAQGRIGHAQGRTRMAFSPWAKVSAARGRADAVILQAQAQRHVGLAATVDGGSRLGLVARVSCVGGGTAALASDPQDIFKRGAGRNGASDDDAGAPRCAASTRRGAQADRGGTGASSPHKRCHALLAREALSLRLGALLLGVEAQIPSAAQRERAMPRRSFGQIGRPGRREERPGSNAPICFLLAAATRRPRSRNKAMVCGCANAHALR